VNDEPGIVARGPDAHPEALVRLLEHQDIAARRRADLMSPDLIGAPRLIHPRVEEVLTVQRPHGAIADLRDCLVDHLTGLDVLDPQRESLVTLDVDGVGDPAPVRAHLEGPEREELVPLRLGVAVQQHLLPLGSSPRLELGSAPTRHDSNPALRCVLLALERARVVPPAPVGRRH